MDAAAGDAAAADGLGVLAKLMRKATATRLDRLAPWWDLPARMIVSTAFIFGITRIASLLGPQTSGLIAPFPVFVLISLYLPTCSMAAAPLRR